MNMKSSELLFTAVIIGTMMLAASDPVKHENGRIPEVVQDSLVKYRDGSYEGQSRYNYKDEPYWGRVRIRIENGVPVAINFVIRDSNLHETFNQVYEKHFQDNPLYIQQCRNDWKGVQTYPVRYLESRRIDKVDAMSGATWSYNIFKASLEEALKMAQNQTK